MAEVTPGVVTADDRILEVFKEALAQAGGTRALIEKRRLDWLPALLPAACAVVLQEEEHHSLEDIQDRLNLGRETVENILSTPGEPPGTLENIPPEARDDAAGRLCRAAFTAVRKRDVRIS